MTQKDTHRSIHRRTLLKASATTAVGLAVFSGAGSADTPDELRFCGCGRVCVQTSSSYRILYATETAYGYTCSLDPSITGTEPRSSDCYTADSGEKIVGVLDGQRTLFLNPNTCAQRAIDALGDLNDCAGCTENDGTEGDCIRTLLTVDDYTKEGKHEYDANGVTIRTRLCKPPDQWSDDPNGPPDGDESSDDDDSDDRSPDGDDDGDDDGRPDQDEDDGGPPDEENEDDNRGPPDEDEDNRGPPDKEEKDEDDGGPPDKEEKDEDEDGGPPDKENDNKDNGGQSDEENDNKDNGGPPDNDDSNGGPPDEDDNRGPPDEKEDDRGPPGESGPPDD